MARSRLEKIGTIYTRTTGLLQSGALHWDDRPLWYDLYEAFPPKEEPRFDRPAPNIPLRNIFYKEDKIRALFHKNHQHLGSVYLQNDGSKSLTQRFIDHYNNIEAKYADLKEGKDETGDDLQARIYQEALDLLKRDREHKSDGADEDSSVSLSTIFKEAQSQKKEESVNIKVTDLFK